MVVPRVSARMSVYRSKVRFCLSRGGIWEGEEIRREKDEEKEKG